MRVSPPSYLKGNSERLVQFNVKNLEGKGINKHVDKGSPKLDKEVQSAKPPITAECKNNQHPHGLEKVPLTLTVSFLIFFSDACVIFFLLQAVCRSSVYRQEEAILTSFKTVSKRILFVKKLRRTQTP